MILIIQLNNDTNTNVRWGTFDNEKDAKSFIQYLMDSISNVENFYLIDLINKTVTKLLDAAKNMQIHKRTFEERMKGV